MTTRVTAASSAATVAAVCLTTVLSAAAWDVMFRSRPTAAACSAAAVVVVALGSRRIERVAERLVVRRDPRHRARVALLDTARSFATTTTPQDTLDALHAVVAEVTSAPVRLWIGDDHELAALADSDAGVGSGPVTSGALVPVVHGDRLVGMIQVADAPDPVRRAAVEDLALLAGPVFAGVMLTRRLETQRAAIVSRQREIAETRRRLLARMDEERRRLERELHDGGQQHLLGLVLRLGVAERAVARDSSRRANLVAELRARIDATRDALADAAAGVGPRALHSGGLAAALLHLAETAPIEVEIAVEPDLDGRLTPATMTALYFACAEALQNVVRHAAATRASVLVGAEGEDEVWFTVTDNGRGFDTATAARSGIVGMADRLEAIDGSVDVVSSPGEGTRVEGRLPCTESAA